MYKKNLIIAGLIALALHIVLIMPLTVTSEPEVIFKKGESSLKMHLVPSVASTASTKSFDNIKEEVQEVEEKIIDNPEPVKKTETPKKEQVKVEEKVEYKQEEIAYGSEYFKTEKKEVDIKKSQVQERKASVIDSKEIIADVKVKGVTKGAMVKNVFKPSYPSSCKRQGHEGTTVLEVTILSKGKCGSIEIIKSAGCESLDKAAIKALKKAKYIPAKRLGVSFTTTKKLAFSFKLEDYK
ncbi:MAG: TonB family protein [Candidatus Scalindua sp.]|jgi:protein TonB|nr:TonB family protein [Candidatus Scalindua sp.]